MSSNAYIGRSQDLDPAPAWFVTHEFVRQFHVDLPLEEVSTWLNDPATFIEGQVWPWRVEFHGGGMEEGVKCNHHGPFLNLPAIVWEVQPGAYRDLRYLYGAYAISPRLVRPTRLQFRTQARRSGGTDVRVVMDCHVHRRFAWAWTRMQRFFWGSFHRWLRRGVEKRRLKAEYEALAALPFVNASFPTTLGTRR